MMRSSVDRPLPAKINETQITIYNEIKGPQNTYTQINSKGGNTKIRPNNFLAVIFYDAHVMSERLAIGVVFSACSGYCVHTVTVSIMPIFPMVIMPRPVQDAVINFKMSFKITLSVVHTSYLKHPWCFILYTYWLTIVKASISGKPLLHTGQWLILGSVIGGGEVLMLTIVVQLVVVTLYKTNLFAYDLYTTDLQVTLNVGICYCRH